MSTRVLQLPPPIANRGDQVGWILLAKNAKRFFESTLLDEAVSSQISTRGVSSDEVLFREKALGSSVVPRGEMDLGQPKCVLVIFSSQVSIHNHFSIDGKSLRVNASSLSPMKMAESYWCLFRASWRQSLKNFSIVAFGAFAITSGLMNQKA